MGHSQAEKARSRERILSAAATQIREAGLESISVGKLMRAAGLTHGGFYNHFGSRSELLGEALERALVDGGARSRAMTGDPRRLAAFVRGYLSRAHRDSASTGCAMAALLSDVGRAEPELRSAMSEHVEGFIARVADELGEDDAIVAVCAMVGALGLARVVSDTNRSDGILKTVRDYVTAMVP